MCSLWAEVDEKPSAFWGFRGRWNYMVLKRFVKSLDFRLQCWVWKKIKLHGTQTTTIPKPRRCTVWKRKKLQWLKPLKITNVQVWEKMKLHGTQTFCEIAWLQTSVLGLEEDKITWCSNPSHKLGNMPKGLEEEITGVSNVCYTLHHGALRGWKRIELHDTQTKAVFYWLFCWVWKRIKLHGTQTHAQV